MWLKKTFFTNLSRFLLDRLKKPVIILHHALEAELPGHPARARFRHRCRKGLVLHDPDDLDGHLFRATIYQRSRRTSLQRIPDAAGIERHDRFSHGQRLKHPDDEPFVAMSADNDIDVGVKRKHLLLGKSTDPEHRVGESQRGGTVFKLLDLSDTDIRTHESIPHLRDLLPDLYKGIQKLYLVLPQVADRPDDDGFIREAEPFPQQAGFRSLGPEDAEIDPMIKNTDSLRRRRGNGCCFLRDMPRDGGDPVHTAEEKAGSDELRHVDRRDKDGFFKRQQRSHP